MASRLLLGFALLCCSCAGTDREACFAEHNAAMAAKKLELCGKKSWDDCPHREAIMEELEERTSRCP